MPFKGLFYKLRRCERRMIYGEWKRKNGNIYLRLYCVPINERGIMKVGGYHGF